MAGLKALAMAVPVAAVTLSGCAEGPSNQTLGTVAGGATGAVVGNVVGGALGGTTARIIGTAVGAIAGAMIGGEIARRLDEGDRKQASQATEQALEEPSPPPAAKPTAASRPVKWRSTRNPDVGGSSTVTGTRRTGAGGECRTVSEVAYIRGEEVRQDSTYCREPGSSGWARQA
jgi:surface antigen